MIPLFGSLGSTEVEKRRSTVVDIVLSQPMLPCKKENDLSDASDNPKNN